MRTVEATTGDQGTHEHSLQLKDVLNLQSTVVHDAEGEHDAEFNLGDCGTV